MRRVEGRNVRCAVLGAGWWATYAHIPALLSHPMAELAAVEKRDRAAARKVADDFGIPLACTSLEEVLDQELDAVVVSNSPDQHYRYTRAALLRGLHVLLEKPMTLTAGQARELVELADRMECHLLISCPWHYTAHARLARQLIQDGALGTLRMISVLMTNPVAGLIRGDNTTPTHGTPYMQPRTSTYSDPAVAGGGQIYTQVSHVGAYLSFLAGVAPQEVFAHFHHDGGRLDIYDTLNIRLEDGCLVSVASTGATPEYRRDYEVRVFGTRGVLFLDLWAGRMALCPLDGEEPSAMPVLRPEEIYPERAPALNLVDCAAGRASNQSPGTLGLASMQLVEAACESARSGRNVIVRNLMEAANA